MLGVAAFACTYLETIWRRNNNCFEKVQTFLLVQAIQGDRKKAEIGSIIYEVRHSLSTLQNVARKNLDG